MKKEDRINQVYKSEKTKHGNDTILLFHVGENYEAYYSDAAILAELTQLRIYTACETIPFVRFAADMLEQYMNRLVDADHSICVSEVRGASGQHILESL